MDYLKRFVAVLSVLSVLSFGLAACNPGNMWSKYDKNKKGKQRIAYYQIHQPHPVYPDDPVNIWKDPGRNQKAFQLAPGTKVDVTETIDGDKYDTPHIIYKIKTADGREGWVPKPWCKQIYK